MIHVSEQSDIKNCPNLNNKLIDCFEEILEKVKYTDIVREKPGTIVTDEKKRVRIDMQMCKSIKHNTYGDGIMYNIQAQLGIDGNSSFACVLVNFYKNNNETAEKIINTFRDAMRKSYNSKMIYALDIYQNN